MKLTRILVPTDFSPSSDNALRLAVSLAREKRASIALLHVAPFPVTTFADVYGAIPIADFEPLLTQIRKESRHMLDRQAGQEVPHDVECLPIVTHGAPVEEIAGEIARGGYELVVMGTHGRKGLTHALLGSVAERVLRHSPVPVLVTR